MSPFPATEDLAAVGGRCQPFGHSGGRRPPLEPGTRRLSRQGLFPLVLAILGLASGIPTVSFGQLDRLLAPVTAAQQGDAAGEAPRKKPAGQSDGYVLSPSELLRQLKSQLAAHYSLNGDLDVDFCREWPAMRLPTSKASVEIVGYPRDGIASSFLLGFKILCGEQFVGEWQVALRARLWQEVWVAEVRLDRGQGLDRTVVASQKVDVLLNHNALLGIESDPSEYEMAQTVGVGQPLTKRDVIEKPVIRKNQIVEAVANRGSIAISMKAQALENGTAKALIKMRNLDSRKEFTAQVMDENHVCVLF